MTPAFGRMRRRLGALWVGLGLIGAAASAASAGPPSEAALHHGLQTALAAQRLAGVAWARVEGDAVHTGALGLADQALGTPLRATATVEVGSVAKPVLALAVLRAVSLGRLSLRCRRGCRGCAWPTPGRPRIRCACATCST